MRSLGRVRSVSRQEAGRAWPLAPMTRGSELLVHSPPVAWAQLPPAPGSWGAGALYRLLKDVFPPERTSSPDKSLCKPTSNARFPRRYLPLGNL